MSRAGYRDDPATVDTKPAASDAGGPLFQLPIGRLTELAERCAPDYRSAEPFPHIVIDDFLPEEVVQRVVDVFPAPGDHDWHRYRNARERKLMATQEASMPPAVRHLLRELNSSAFVDVLERLTGIDGLIPDPHLEGGGMHQIEPGGLLKVHADFNRHPRLGLERRLNLLLYLNRDWKDEYGGHLELWDREMTSCVRRILPIFNRCVIFSTARHSYHGHPAPLTCPPGMTRRSLALYYYSSPQTAGLDAHSTIFQRVPGEARSVDAAVVRLRLRALAHDLLPPMAARGVRRLHDPRIEVVVVNVEDDIEVGRVAGETCLALQGNPGYAAAVNAGAARATAEVVVFMNDDLVLRAGDVLTLAAVIRAGIADVAVPLVEDGTGRAERTILPLPGPASLAREWWLLPDTPVDVVARRVRVEKWRMPGRRERVMAASAACVAVRRDLLLAEPLPEDYFLYWEENEWFWRLHRRGAVCVFDPSARARHDAGRDDVRPEKSRLLARNAVRCVRRTRGRRAAMVAWPVVIAWNARLVMTAVVRRRRALLSPRLAGLGAAVAAWREI